MELHGVCPCCINTPHFIGYGISWFMSILYPCSSFYRIWNCTLALVKTPLTFLSSLYMFPKNMELHGLCKSYFHTPPFIGYGIPWFIYLLYPYSYYMYICIMHGLYSCSMHTHLNKGYRIAWPMAMLFPTPPYIEYGAAWSMSMLCTVQTFNSCTSRPDVCHCLIVHTPMDNISRT